jgi:hypothetical protein
MIVAAAAFFFPLSAYAQSPTLKSCADADGGQLELNRILEIPAQTSVGYTLQLRAGQGVIIDLVDPENSGFAGAAEAAADAAMATIDAAAVAATEVAASDTAMDAATAADTVPTVATDDLIRICRATDKKQMAPGLSDRVFDDFGGDLQYTGDGNRLYFLAPADGTYIVDLSAALANRVAEAKRPMEIFVRNRDIARTADAIKLDDKSRLAAKNRWIASGSFDGNVYGPIYSFTGKTGQQIIVSLADKTATAFDPFFRLATPTAQSSLDLIIADDDGTGTGTLNAKLVKTLAESGVYRVQVGGFGQPGEYELTLSVGPPPSAQGRKLAFGKDAPGSLATNDVFEFPVQVGRSYTVKIKNPDDPSMLYGVELLIENPINPSSGIVGADSPYSSIAFGEAGGISGASFTFAAATKRTMYVRAQSYDFSVDGGNYVISVEESR